MNIHFFRDNSLIELTDNYSQKIMSFSNVEFKIDTPQNILIETLGRPLDDLKQLFDKSRKAQEELEDIYRTIDNLSKKYPNLKETNIYQLAKQGLHRMQSSYHFIPAERNIISNLSDSIMGVLADGISIPKFILEFGRRFEIARNEIKKIYIDFLNVTYEYSFEIGNKIFISPEQSISLSEAASGLQSVIPLYLVVKHFAESDLLVIEEPELNLFPETQKKLVEFIIETCRDKTKRLIITTHSPYILTVLNNLIQAHNVVKERPELEEEVNKITPKERWLDFDKVGVYYVADGTVKNIMHEKNRIIKAENIDSVSKNLSNEFGQLLDLQYGD
jgi:hypothetical protein